jgi:hypothetical protein
LKEREKPKVLAGIDQATLGGVLEYETIRQIGLRKRTDFLLQCQSGVVELLLMQKINYQLKNVSAVFGHDLYHNY